MLIGFLATLVAQGVKIAMSRSGKPIDRRWITVGLYVIALVLAYAWASPMLPAFPAPVEDPALYAGLVIGFIGQLVAAASAVVGFATLVYNLLLARVFAAFGWDSKPAPVEQA